jgi:hypothetical protein
MAIRSPMTSAAGPQAGDDRPKRSLLPQSVMQGGVRTQAHHMLTVMPGLVPGLHVQSRSDSKDVDGRDTPGTARQGGRSGGGRPGAAMTDAGKQGLCPCASTG